MDIKGSDEVWAYDQARAVRATFIDLGEAVVIAVKLGVSFGYIVFVIAWFVFLADFRGMMMLARRGKFPHFNPKFTDFRYATEYTGVHISQSIITLVLFATFATIFIVPCLWDLTRNLIFNLIKKHYYWLLIVFLPSIVQYIANETFVQSLANEHKIVSRGIWAIWEIYSLISQLLAGIAIGIARWIVTVFLSAFSVARVERSSLPQWMLGITPLLDIVASKVHSMVYMTHCHNAPAMRVAAWLFEASVGVAEERREQDELQLQQVPSTKPGGRGAQQQSAARAGGDGHNNKKGGGLFGLFGGKHKKKTTLVAHDIQTSGASSKMVSKYAASKKHSTRGVGGEEQTPMMRVLTTKQNRARNRFYIGVLLHHNPHLRKLRKKALAAERERKAEALAEAVKAEKATNSCFGICGGTGGGEEDVGGEKSKKTMDNTI